jgi:hypothetical protein
MDYENSVDLAFFSVSDGVDLDDVVRNSVRIKPKTVIPYLRRDSGLDGLKAELEDRNIDCRLEN